MTDLEFDILDELYFVITFSALVKTLEMEEVLLKKELLSMIQKGWVKVMRPNSDEEIEQLDQYEAHFMEYAYLATKKGLMVHNIKG